MKLKIIMIIKILIIIIIIILEINLDYTKKNYLRVKKVVIYYQLVFHQILLMK